MMGRNVCCIYNMEHIHCKRKKKFRWLFATCIEFVKGEECCKYKIPIPRPEIITPANYTEPKLKPRYFIESSDIENITKKEGKTMTEKTFKFQLGDEVKDKITGFKGIIRGRTQYLTGCNTYGLQNQKLNNQKPADWQWFDEDLLILVKEKKIVLNRREGDGGPLSKDHFPPSR